MQWKNKRQKKWKSEKKKEKKQTNKQILFCFTSPKQSLCTSAQKSKHNDITQTPMPYSNQ